MDPAVQRTNKLKLIWGLISLIGPTALIIASLLLYAIFNYFYGMTAGSSDELFGAAPSPFMTLINILLYIVGMISVITWLPGIVIGIVLLATRK